MIAIICGSGELPLDISRSLFPDVFCVLIKGCADPADYVGIDYVESELLDLQSIVAALLHRSIKEVVLAGKVVRPKRSDIINRGLEQHISQISIGDDSIMRSAVTLLASFGIKALDVRQFAPEFLEFTPINALSNVHQNDIKIGCELLEAIGCFDVGQGVIVENGLVLGVEAAEGTDALIERCAILKKGDNKSGVLIKMPKKTQTMLADVPVIGLQTMKLIVQSGFSGLAISSDVIVLNRDVISTFAASNDIFLSKIISRD